MNMVEDVKQAICMREYNVHMRNMKSIEIEYDEAFEKVSKPEELLELNRWAEVTRAKEAERFVNTVREFLTDEKKGE
jgi:ribosomal protein L31E